MKKTILLIIIFAVFAAASVTAFGKKEDKPSKPAGADSEAVEAVPENNTESPSGFQQVPASPGEIRGKVPQEMEITGLVERGFENRISIVVNPQSKSRVSYYPDKKAAVKLEKMLGRTVTVTGIVRGTGNPFKKEIEISEIKK